MLKRVQTFVQKMYGDTPALSLEQWSLQSAKLCTADDIIAAAIIESFAKDWDDWKVEVSNNADFERDNRQSWYVKMKEINIPYSSYDVNRLLFNKKKNIHLVYALTTKRKGSEIQTIRTRFAIGAVELSSTAGNRIAIAYDDLYNKYQADMERKMRRKREKAWQLAEGLLNMKRNEFGALVPVVTCTE